MNIFVCNLGNDEKGDGTAENPFENLDHAYGIAEDGDTITYRFAQDTVYSVQQLECGCKVTVDQGHFITVVIECEELANLYAEMKAAIEKCRLEFSPENESAAIKSFAAVEEHTGVLLRHVPEAGLIHDAAVKAKEIEDAVASRIWSS